MQIINPLTYPNWDDLVSRHSGATIFHSSAWARVLHETYGYEPIYFAAMNGNELKSLIPVMEVNSTFTGKRGVSLPFTDFCCALSDSDEGLLELYQNILKYGRLKNWKYVEFREKVTWKQKPGASSIYLVHMLDLNEDADRIFKTFRSSTRRNIKKGRKLGVEIEIRKDAGALSEYYRLHTITRKRQGLPPQPRRFFGKIHKHIISRGRGFVVLAKHGSKYVAGAVYFHFRKNAIYKYGASDKAFQHLRANNLVMWEAIKWFIEKGFDSFHFGRTGENNRGLIQFKRGWGTKEGLLKYHKFDFKKSVFVNSDNGRSHSYTLFKFLPNSLCQLAGALAYKHFA